MATQPKDPPHRPAPAEQPATGAVKESKPRPALRRRLLDEDERQSVAAEIERSLRGAHPPWLGPTELGILFGCDRKTAYRMIHPRDGEEARLRWRYKPGRHRPARRPGERDGYRQADPAAVLEMLDESRRTHGGPPFPVE